MNLNQQLNQSQLAKYAAFLKAQGLSDSSIKRKLSSLSSFQKFLVKKGLITPEPTSFSATPTIPTLKVAPPRIFSRLGQYVTVATLIIILFGLGYGLYNQTILKAKKNLAYSTAAATIVPNRILSFQGRLTDSSGNPINSNTGIIFNLYNAGTGGTQLYNSGTGNSQTVTPDENGIFSVIIGKTHGAGIPSTVFSENADVYLEIVGGGETMTPRQQIATVGYALNAESLQGLPPSASGFKDSVPVIDGLGNINLGETSPSLKSISGTLGIEGQAVLIKATDGSGGNITINPDGAGILKLLTEGTGTTAGGQIEATNANLATGNLFGGLIRNDNRGYNFLSFQNYNVGTTTLSTRFSVDANGNVNSSGTITASIGITAPKITLTTGAVNGYILQTDANGNSTWVNPGSAGIGSSYDAGSGLSRSGSIFSLGGAITQDTRLNIGNTESFYIKQATGNVGIGTTSPGGALEVRGTGTIFRVARSTDNLEFVSTSSTTGISTLYGLNISTVPITFTNSNVQLARVSNGLELTSYADMLFKTSNPSLSESMRLTSGGNLGIGTTNPAKKLDVVGDINLTGTIFSNGTSGTSGQILTSTGTGLQWVNSSSVGGTYVFSNGLTNFGSFIGLGGTLTQNTQIGTSSFHFDFIGLGGTQSLHIDESGNVGIGTTDPTSKLTITAGDIALDSNRNLYWGTGGTQSGLQVNSGYFRYLYAGNEELDINVNGSNSNIITNMLGNLQIGTSANNTDLILSPNRNTYITSGNLGIGTTSPSKKLTINGASTSSGLRINYDEATYGNTIYGDIFHGGNAGGFAISSVSNGYSPSATIRFLTGSTGTATERMRISDTGSLGIGTTAPSKKLDVAGDINLTGTIFSAGTSGSNGQVLTSTGTGLQWVNAASVGGTYTFTNGLTNTAGTVGLGGTLTQNTQIGTSSFHIDFIGLGGTQSLHLDESGNVGIGTTATNRAKLDIEAGYGINTGLRIGIGSSTVGALWGGNASTPDGILSLYGGANENVRIRGNDISWLNGGNVGIGTTNPGYTLEVVGTGNFSTSINSAIFNVPSFNTRITQNYLQLYGSLGSKLSSDISGNLTFGIGSTSLMYLSNTGSLGIGTTNPSKKLDIVGDINLTGTIFSNGASGTSGQILSSTGTGLQWVSSSSVGGTYTFTNGLTNTAGSVGLGGTLTSNTQIGTSSFGLSFLGLGGTQGLYVSSTGFVGIGTTSPSNKLTINGSSDITGNLMIGTTGPIGSDGFAENSVLSIVAPTAGGGGRERLLFAKVADSNNYFSVINTTSSSGLFIPTFVGYAPDSSASQGAVYFDGRIASANDTATGIPAIVFRAQQLDGTTAITNRPIVGFGSGTYGNDMKMVVMSGGNVGIGTTAPSKKLDIAGDINLTGTIFSNGASGTSGQVLTSTGTGLAWVNNVGTTYTFQNGINLTGSNVGLGGTLASNTIINTGANTLSFLGLGNTQSLFIGATGFVGIGTTNPTAKLQVVGIDNFNTVQAANIGGSIGTGLVVTNFNRVGVGTTAPGAAFDISGPNTGVLRFTNTSGKTIDFTPGIPGISNNGLNIRNVTNTVDWMTIDGSGNVGIGTTVPSKKLDVSGDINLTGTIFAAGTSGTSGQLLTSTGTGLQWVNASGIGGTYTFTNGLTNASGSVGLGGTLTSNTQIGTSSFSLTLGTNTTSPSLFIASNGNVGVGTTIAYGKFNVVGSQGQGRAVVIDNREISFIGTGVAHMSIYGPDTGKSFLSIQNTSSNVSAGTTGTDLFTITSAGNVGIGTTGPTSPLQVAGNANIVGKIFAGGGGGTPITASLNIQSGADNVVSQLIKLRGTQSADAFQIQTSTGTGGDFFTITSTGNVGIGISSPTKKLDVSGDINLTGTIFATGTSGTSGQVLTSTGTGLQWVNATSVGGTYTFTNGLTNTAGSVGLGGTLTSNTSLSISSFGLGIGTTGNAAYPLSVSGTASFTNIYNAGLVGIGSTSPGSKLYVASTGSSLPSDFNSNQNVLTVERSATSSNPPYIAIVSHNAAFGGIRFSDSDAQASGAIEYDHNINKLILTTNGVKTVFLDSSGNFGIGATTPKYKLEVNGDALISTRLGIGSTDPLYALHVGSSAVRFDNNLSVGGTVTFAGIPLGTGSTILYINSSGNLVQGTLPASTAYTATNGLNLNGSAFGLGGTLTADTIINTASSSLSFQGLGNTQSLFIGASGYVGVGTTNPTFKLDMGGPGTNIFNVSPVSSGGYIYFAGRQNNSIRYAANELGIYTNQSSGLNFYTGSGNNRVRIDNAGNFGIGTTNPSKKLDVTGDINLTGTIFTTGTSGSSGQVLTSTGTGLAWVNNVGTTYSFQNGINLTGSNVGLGGTLVSNTTINTDINSLSFLGLGNSQSLFIGASGFVGIGTTNPQTSLDVTQNSAFSAQISLTNNNSSSTTAGSLFTIGQDIITNNAYLGYNNSGYTVSNIVTMPNSAYYASGVGASNGIVIDTQASNAPIIFATGGYAYGNERLRITGAGNVGIGTTNPSKKLDIAGDINLTGTIFTTGTSGSSGQVLSSTGTGLAWVNASVGATYSFTNGLTETSGSVGLGGTLTQASYTNINMGTGASGLLFLGLGNSQSLFISAAGNIGVATTAPNSSYMIDVLGRTRSTRFASTAGSAADVSYNMNSSSGLGMYSPGANLLGLSTSAVERLRIDTAGNVGIGTSNPGGLFQVGTADAGGTGAVLTFKSTGLLGIGTTNPSKKLDVNGDINLTGTIFASGASGTSGQVLSSTGTGLAWVSGAGTTYTFTNGLTNTAGSVGLGGTLTQANYTNINIGAGSSGLLFLGLGNTQSLFIGTSGWVGIGTTSPTAPLNIFSGTGVESVRISTPNGKIVALGSDSGGFGKMTLSDTNGNNIISFRTDGSVNFVNAGRFGIGTSTPVYKLDVVGDANFSTRVGIGGTNVLYTLNAGGTASFNTLFASSKISIGTTAAGAPLNIELSTAAQQGITVKNTSASSGNFYAGVGVVGNAGSSGMIYKANSNYTTYKTIIANDLGFYNNTSGNISILNDIAAGKIFLTAGAASTVHLAVDTTGNVGIGTTSPAKKLDVVGDIKLTGTLFVGAVGVTGTNGQVLASDGAGSLQWLSVGGTYTFGNGISNTAGTIGLGGTLTQAGYTNINIGTGSSGLLFLGAGNTQSLFVSPNGNVGIGTTGPVSLLTVNGEVAGSKFTDIFDYNRYFFDPGNSSDFTSSASIHGNGSLTFNALDIGGTQPQKTIYGTASTRLKNFVNGFAIGVNTGTGASNTDISWTDSLFVGGTNPYLGHVGIGTTAPQGILDIKKDSSNIILEPEDITANNQTKTSPVLNLVGNYDSVVGLGFGNGWTTFQMANTPTTAGNSRFGLSFASNTFTLGTEALSVLSTGNVGISTTSPVFKLQVTADVTYPNNLTDGTAQLSLTGATDPLKRINIGYDTSAAGNGFGFIAAGKYTTGWTNLALQPTGGNVGIGTTNPIYNLEVVGTGSFSSSVSSAIINVSSYNTRLTQNYLQLYGTNGSKISSTNTGNLTFGIGNTNFMYLSNVGSLGIGTTNPAANLEVVSGQVANGIRLLSGSNSSYTGLSIGRTGTEFTIGTAAAAGNWFAGSSAGDIALVSFGKSIALSTTSGNAPSMFIKANGGTAGNIGIGTTNPGNLLTVVGGDTQIRVGEVSSTYYFDMGRNQADGLFQINGSQGLGYKWLNNGTEVMRIDSTGDVGIGTSNPVAPLQVGNMDAGSSGSYAVITSTGAIGIGTSSPSGQFQIRTTNGGMFIDTNGSVVYNRIKSTANVAATGKALLLNTGSGSGTSPDIYIDTAGHVGMGTTAPGTHTLSVVGTAGLTAGTAWTSTSDRRFKNIESNLNGTSLDKLMALHPVSFRWNDLHNSKFGSTSDKLNLGFIAQEVEAVIPDMITTDSEGYKWYNPSGFESLLTAGVQELNAKISDLNITSEGQINYSSNVSDSVLLGLGYSGSKNEIESATYSLTSSLGVPVTKMAQFAKISTAKITAGLVSTTNLIAKNIIAETTKSKVIKTDLITPLDDVTGTIVIDGNLKAKEATFTAVYADKFIGKEGNFGDVMTNKIASLRGEMESLIANMSTQTTLPADASPSALMAEAQTWTFDSGTSQTQITGSMSLSDNMVIGAKLTVNGDSQFGNAFISGRLQAGEIAIKDNFIETTNSALLIQPSGLGSIHLLKDTMVIADNGEVTITGNLSVTGNITASTATVSGSLFANLINADEVNTKKINVATDTPSVVIAEASTASGASSSAQLSTNATAGVVTLPAGKTELVISNPKLTTNSIVYLTPAGSTNNQVVYLKSKSITPAPSPTGQSNSNFTIAIDQPLTSDININWWIIN